MIEPRVVSIPMRDGVELVADVYASGSTPRTVILERTPYGRRATRGSDQDRHDAPVPTPDVTSTFFVESGYTVVRQDCRGRGDSGGTFVKYLNEGPDGADTIDWIAAQPWCDGTVVMMGVSYSAHVQAAAAAGSPRALAATFMDSGGFASAYEAGMRMGGAFELKQVTWAFNHARESPEALADPVVAAALGGTELGAWFGAFPWKRGNSPLRFAPEYESYLLDQWDNDAFGDFWKQPAIYARGSYEDFPDAPSLHLGSWYDPYVRSTIENFHRLREVKSAPSYLLMGPWTHGARTRTFAGDTDFGPSAAFDVGLGRSYLEFRRDWFDAQLGRSAENTFAPVTYFLMGGGSGGRTAEGRLDHGGSWHVDENWPPAGSRPLDLYLGPDGALTRERPAEPDAVTYDFDPADPVPTIGGQVTSGEPVMVGGGFDQTPDERVFGAVEPYLPLSARADVVTLRTEPLDEDLVVAGPVRARLWISSSAVDTDFTIKLIDEYPPSEDYPQGFALNLTDGIFRCRFHESFERPSPLVPGRLYAIEVEAPDTANLFAAGHRIRLDVSSSNFPRFDVNPNTGEPVATDRTRCIARNTVHLGGEHASVLSLTVVPAVSG